MPIERSASPNPHRGEYRPARSGVIAALLAMSVLPAGQSAGEVRLAAAPTADELEIERTVFVMGTSLRITIASTRRADALAASEHVIEAFDVAEQRLSTWRDDSELSRLNVADDGATDDGADVSAALHEDLSAALACAAATGGAFDPTVGALVEAWGLRTYGARPDADVLDRALDETGYEKVSMDAAGVHRPNGLQFETGGFGKGVGLRDAIAALSAQPKIVAASLDIGGQIAVYQGGDRHGDDWAVTIADPAARQRPVIALTIPHGSVATTGTSERGNHVLDPRTGHPVEAHGSVSVWTDDPVRADCLSTALFVMGSEAALDWAAGTDGVEALVIEPLVIEPLDGRLLARATPKLFARLRAIDEDIVLTQHPPEPPTTRD